jgi:hypothetical protein
MSSTHSGRIFIEVCIGDFFTKTCRENQDLHVVTIGGKCWGVLWLKTELTVTGDTVAVTVIDHYGVFDDGI